MAENQHENSTNPRAGVVLSSMDNPDEIWPHRCGADYVANLAPPIDWNAAAARCRARCERDMAVSASRIGAGGDVASEMGD
ncbi:hypothetical protein FMA36_00195 [Komagataeibacter xylinus]|uniref:Uncharacterized protein n=2 Tax=Komagataeibacter xylinus TaxID=28448 RepID=A0A857FUL6_KOMXY|nr:hypothetical protein FMA36_00195 [Komagataeibacter xylinus]